MKPPARIVLNITLDGWPCEVTVYIRRDKTGSLYRTAVDRAAPDAVTNAARLFARTLCEHGLKDALEAVSRHA